MIPTLGRSPHFPRVGIIRRFSIAPGRDIIFEDGVGIRQEVWEWLGIVFRVSEDGGLFGDGGGCCAGDGGI